MLSFIHSIGVRLFIAMLFLGSLVSTGCVSPDSDSEMATHEMGFTVSTTDFAGLDQINWSGTLSYLNYGSSLRSSIPVEIEVKDIGETVITYEIRYPDEPQYNGVLTVDISSDGTEINGKSVTLRDTTEEGYLLIVAEGRGEDNGQAADEKTIYEIGSDRLSIATQYRPDGDDKYFERNRYVFSR